MTEQEALATKDRLKKYDLLEVRINRLKELKKRAVDPETAELCLTRADRTAGSRISLGSDRTMLRGFSTEDNGRIADEMLEYLDVVIDRLLAELVQEQAAV